MSLVEVMVAMVILLFVSLALLQTLTLTLNVNMKNALMDEAVKVAGERLDRIRNTAFDSMANQTVWEPRVVKNAKVRSIDVDGVEKEIGYRLATTVSLINSPGGTVAFINTNTSWRWRGQTYSYLLTTMRRK